MAAGIASLRLLRETNPYAKLDRNSGFLAAAVREAATRKGLPLQVARAGSMFSLFFTESTVHSYDDALKTDADVFRKLFHYALERGVYLPPSPFETCFISSAHSEEHLDTAVRVLNDGILAI